MDNVDRTIAYYDQHATEYWQKTVNLDLNKQRKAFTAFLPGGGSILDAGCGSGRDTKAFLTMGFDVTAIDASSELAELASTYAGQPCLVQRIQDVAYCEMFDGVWACASLLHIPRAQIKGALACLVRSLRVEGVLYMSLKEGTGEQQALDGRLFVLYTPDEIRGLCGGLPLEELNAWRDRGHRSQLHIEPWLNFILRKTR